MLPVDDLGSKSGIWKVMKNTKIHIFRKFQIFTLLHKRMRSTSYMFLNNISIKSFFYLQNRPSWSKCKFEFTKNEILDLNY